MCLLSWDAGEVEDSGLVNHFTTHLNQITVRVNRVHLDQLIYKSVYR